MVSRLLEGPDEVLRAEWKLGESPLSFRPKGAPAIEINRWRAR
jgi:hypothetical protein